MIKKKYRVKNTKTGNFVSEELNNWKATELCSKLTMMNNGVTEYEIIEVEEKHQAESASPIRRMTEDEIKAVRALQQLKSIYQSEFRDSMVVQVQTGELKITDKQAGYLWFLVYRYRRNFNDAELISTAEKLKTNY